MNKYYEVVSISEKPEKEDYYIAKHENGIIGNCYWTGEEWRWYKNVPDKATGLTHYLKPLTSLPVDRETAGKIWEAALQSRRHIAVYNIKDEPDIEIIDVPGKDKETYLKQFS